MEIFHNGRKHQIYTRVKVPEIVAQYVYFIRIGQPEERLYKIGTANNIKRRMLEHCSYYNKPIFILWISPRYSKYTTLRVEDKNKERWIDENHFIYLKNDRFIIPSNYSKIVIKVRKEYEILLE